MPSQPTTTTSFFPAAIFEKSVDSNSDTHPVHKVGDNMPKIHTVWLLYHDVAVLNLAFLEIFATASLNSNQGCIFFFIEKNGTTMKFTYFLFLLSYLSSFDRSSVCVSRFSMIFNDFQLEKNTRNGWSELGCSSPIFDDSFLAYRKNREKKTEKKKQNKNKTKNYDCKTTIVSYCKQCQVASLENKCEQQSFILYHR